MAAMLVNEGRTGLLSALLTFLEGCKAGLFTTNHTPVATDTLATFAAIEAAMGGYVRQTAAGWSAAVLDANGNAQVTGPTLAFTATGTGLPVTAYGYFIIDPTGTFCVLAELAAVPFTYTAAGQSFLVTPNLFLGALGLPY